MPGKSAGPSAEAGRGGDRFPPTRGLAASRGAGAELVEAVLPAGAVISYTAPGFVIGSHLSGNLTRGKSGSAVVRKATMESAGVVESAEVSGVVEFSEVPGMKKWMEVTMHVEEERRSDRNADWRVP
jgi:hypothetical protein